MERFSSYNDPFLGINPFVNPKRPTLSFAGCLKALVKMPLIVILLVTNINIVGFLIKIESKSVVRPRVLAANASSFIDIYVLRYLTGIRNFYYVAKNGFIDIRTGKVCKKPVEPCVLFPEGCRTNNRAVLQFVRDVKVDHVCGLRYTGGCVSSLHDRSFGSIFRFLASNNSVKVEFEKSSNLMDICRMSGLPQVKLDINDWSEFVQKFNKDS